jgi:predicted SAM-dependent methyltransferase
MRNRALNDSFLKQFIRRHTTRGFTEAAIQARDEWKLRGVHRRELKKVPKFLSSSPLKLNLGCGPNLKSGWVNIDLFDPGADLRLDLREKWPFPDGSVSRIYSEHVFEHFDYFVEVPHFLSESLRVLRKGGTFDVGVPDTSWPLVAYGHPDNEYWSVFSDVHPKEYETQIEHINFHFRQEGEHKYAWDNETLSKVLKASGFQSVTARQYDPTLDSETRQPGTLYVTGIKP